MPFVIDANLGQVDHTKLLGLGIAGVNIHVRTTDHKPPFDPNVVFGLGVVKVPTFRDILALGDELGFRLELGRGLLHIRFKRILASQQLRGMKFIGNVNKGKQA